MLSHAPTRSARAVQQRYNTLAATQRNRAQLRGPNRRKSCLIDNWMRPPAARGAES